MVYLHHRLGSPFVVECGGSERLAGPPAGAFEFTLRFKISNEMQGLVKWPPKLSELCAEAFSSSS